MPRLRFLGFAVAVVVWSSVALPAVGQWRPIGPAGGGVSRPAVAGPATPDIAYVTGGSNLYRTEDGGESWHVVQSDGAGAVLVAVDPRDPERIYSVGSLLPDHQLFRSDDGGHHFVPADGGLPGAGQPGSVGRLLVSPRDGSLIVVWSSKLGNGLYASADRGAHWVRRRAPSGVDVMAFSPAGRLWIAQRIDCTDYDVRPPQPCSALHLAWSDDLGRTWQGSDWPRLREARATLAFRFGAGDPERVFLLATDLGWYGFRVYVARRRGEGRWARITPPGDVMDLVALDHGRLLATGTTGRQVSLDEGRTWQSIGEREPNLWSLQTTAAGRLLGNGFDDLFVSTDGGLHFGPAHRGIQARCMGGLSTSAADDSLWTFGDLGSQVALYEKIEDGTPWRAHLAIVPGYEDYGTELLARSPSDPGTAYAILSTDVEHVVFAVTHDRGVTWNARTAPPIPPDRSSANTFLAVDPENTERVYWVMLSGLHGLLWRTDDGGGSWSRQEGLPAHFVGDFAIAAWNGPEIFVIDRGQLLRSTDAGGSFLPVGQGLPPGVDASVGQILAFDPARPGHLFVVDARAAYESVDDGTSFHFLGGLPSGDSRSLGVTAWGELMVSSRSSRILRWRSSRGRFEVVGGVKQPFGEAEITLDAQTRTRLFAAPYECRGVWQLDLEP